MNARMVPTKDAETENAGGVNLLGKTQSGFFMTIHQLARPGIGFADQGSKAMKVTVGENRGCSAHEESMNLSGPIANKNSESGVSGRNCSNNK